MVQLHVFKEQTRHPIMDTLKQLDTLHNNKMPAHRVFVHTDRHTKAGQWPVNKATGTSTPVLAHFMSADLDIILSIDGFWAPPLPLVQLVCQEMNVNRDMYAIIPFDVWAKEDADYSMEDVKLSIMCSRTPIYMSFHSDRCRDLGSTGNVVLNVSVGERAEDVPFIDLDHLHDIQNSNYTQGLKNGYSLETWHSQPAGAEAGDYVSIYEGNLLVQGHRAWLDFDNKMQTC